MKKLNVKILHISEDEKFIDMGLKTFERVAPNCNRLIVLTNNKKANHIKFESSVTSKNKISLHSKLDSFWDGVDILVFHSLCILSIDIPKNIKVIWLGFGFDYYSFINNEESKLADKTKIIYKKLYKLGVKNRVKLIVKKILFYEYRLAKKRKSLINRIDIFCPVLLSEYELINWPSSKKPKLMDWNYGTIEDDWAKPTNCRKLNGRNILLGNSATLTCNHIDALDYLDCNDSQYHNLIIPLSYGNKHYAEKVKEHFLNSYPGESIFIEDFINFDDYMKLISSCSYVIMAHKRQQALGNIISLVYLGAKLFLDEENPLYDFFISKGLTIYRLCDLKSIEWNRELTDIQIKNNRDCLNDNWSRECIDKKTEDLIWG